MSNCIFCKILSKEIPGKIIYEDDFCIAFDDINPQAPVHVLLVPREHVPTFNDLTEDKKELLGNLCLAVNRIAEIKKIKDPGYRIVINCNPAGGQMVYHLHIHVMGGRQMAWPPG
ncbi:MAG: histidine triad nucleotide-binding protein [Nitrospirae bacterium RIFCSPLOW2_12_42_9]|uniref:Diadenosine tetraphosphate (Ap4A) hydrolase and other HIT family hydrolase n=1 Tax=Candidatus Uhrbacteria bacterium GW2011_GWF2_41_16 TaxID=1618997 RepID=A0A0G0XHG7_9BACT|nr:MAG: Diadenosine tetraphosphate (Ap4A) hydrolase and other HIT family hydrolase [Candidatus Uhrbacteria bacterium GW2011_GWF2_41_16]OGW13521.1 MAG: histidine triad nucleotide-binding protein [Nitrospirae bacterium GWA2_42_11]OGW54556.1 MAG: histidine triad nucleotide-binding protein [Nitrospirae bacterium RIFCSPLOWO2_02_42_7]OGW56588.1 MAG: histidine triad nucleotide-binding protein [Nitrospirae bacterium RIFCSPLOW2_12_42_9]OGW57052.1 MAG: histidine triad nucleotide-binding protein [Nitrospi